ncbi:hypothetical protein GCM10009530_23540 [Microbispora corallina]|uniref:Secreted protein n=1 Tax=Microbispora corallina TaxID=83302 RepID=A0ABQ4G7F4_9ACTN|nr:hypothetical protein [Microbispora corallina]GIH43003.1 hypothetical protein Mco01_60030 [Microbispora corallina]
MAPLRNVASAPWWAGVSGLAAVVALVAAAVFWWFPRPAGPAPAVVAATGSSSPSATAGTAGTAHPVRRAGTLTVHTGWGYDLDATGRGPWPYVKGRWGEREDVGYYVFEGDPRVTARADGDRVAVLPPAASYDYRDCAAAAFTGAADHPPTGPDVQPGRGICVRTSDDHLALLTVTAYDRDGVTVNVTVWQ